MLSFQPIRCIVDIGCNFRRVIFSCFTQVSVFVSKRKGFMFGLCLAPVVRSFFEIRLGLSRSLRLIFVSRRLLQTLNCSRNCQRSALYDKTSPTAIKEFSPLRLSTLTVQKCRPSARNAVPNAFACTILVCFTVRFPRARRRVSCRESLSNLKMTPGHQKQWNTMQFSK